MTGISIAEALRVGVSHSWPLVVLSGGIVVGYILNEKLRKIGMTPLQRLRWWFSGIVAKEIVENYDSPTDAILTPLYGASLSFGIGYAGMIVLESGALALGAVLMGFAVLLAGMTLIWLSASVRYATETTELPTSHPDPYSEGDR